MDFREVEKERVASNSAMNMTCEVPRDDLLIPLPAKDSVKWIGFTFFGSENEGGFDFRKLWNVD